MSVVVVGSVNMDLVFSCERFPLPGETLLGGEFAEHPGGKGANQAVAIGRLGGEVALVGAVGDDGFGDRLLASLKGGGVDNRYVQRCKGTPSGCAMIAVDSQGRNMIVVAPGANSLLTRLTVMEAVDCEDADYILAQLEVPFECVGEAASWGPLILNPAPARPIPPEILRKTHTITPNESEAELLTRIKPVDEKSCLAIGTWFLRAGVKNVVITLGERGCWWMNDFCHLAVPGFAVKTVDTTAAGDAFNGALAWSLSEGKEFPEALRFANAVAALSTTKRGAQPSMPSLTEVQVFLSSR